MAVRWEVRRARVTDDQRFAALTDRAAADIARRVSVYRHALVAIRGTYAASENVTRDEFAAMWRQSDFERDFPGAVAVGFVRRVPRDGIAAFLERTRADGAPDFALVTAGDGAELMVNEFLEPREVNAAAIGFDIAQEARRRAAAERAMLTGEPTLSENLTLRQAEDAGAAFVYLLPIYARGASARTPDERRAATVGWAVAHLLARPMLAGVEQSTEGEIAFDICDTGQVSADPCFYRSAATARAAGAGAPDLRATVPIEVGHRSWIVTMRSTPAFREESRASAAALGLGGAALSIVLGFLVRSQGSAARRAGELAEKMTADLRRLAMVAERTTNAVVITDAQKRIVWVNDGFTRISGYTLEEVLGKSPGAMLQCERTDPVTKAAIRERLSRGESFRGEILNRAKDGREYWLDLDIQPLRDENGVLTGFLAIETDVTERVEQRRELARSEARFRSLVEDSEVIVWEFDASADHYTYVSPQADRIGYRLQEWMRPGFLAAHVHADDREVVMKFRAEQLHAGEARKCQYRMMTASGREIWLDEFVSPAEDVDGRAMLRGVLVDITEQKEMELQVARAAAAAAEANAALEEAQAVGRLGNWSFDLATGRVSWSRQLFRLFGREEKDGPPDFAGVLSDYCDEDGERLRRAVERAAKQGTAYSLVMRTRHGRNGVRYIRGEGRARRNESGAVVRLFGTAMDVTAEVEREEELRIAKQEAEAANRSKSEFLANMSHEIRTPMAAILGYTDLLADEGDRTAAPESRLEYIDTIKRNGEHLLTLINDILDLSKIEAGKMTVELLETSPEAVVSDVIALMQVKAQAKALSLAAEYATALPAVIRTDPVRLRQILVNLVGNALKFTEVGGVRVRVSFDGAASRLRIDVIDTGIGLSEDAVSKLFRAFVQADASTTRRFGGTGLGLQISKRLATMLGGDIAVESEPGRGSIFTLTVACGELAGVAMVQPGSEARPAAAPRAATAIAAAATAERPLAGVRILLAEDGPDNQRLVSHHLRRAGAEVRIADNGKLAIEALTTTGTIDGPLLVPAPFDVVLTDMQMPEMDGYDAARLLRSKGCVLPIIALTAHAMSGDRDRCIEAGCDSYTTKPIDKAKLIEVCQRAASGELRRGLQAPAPAA